MRSVLEKLIERHGTYGTDWMGFTISRKNPLTYHHIQKNCHKGKRTIENGALLTKRAHRFLNCIEKDDPELYDEWNALFRDINDSELPPNEGHLQKIKTLREKSFD